MSDQDYQRDRASILEAWAGLKDGNPPKLELARADSRAVWSFLLAKEADNRGDVDLLSKLRVDAVGPLGFFLDLYLRERRETPDAVRDWFLNNWREAEGPWSWLWEIEGLLQRRTLHGVRGEFGEAQSAAEKALAKARAEDWPGYVCSSSYQLVWHFYQKRDHFAARRHLELFRENAERIGARYYLAFYNETRAYLDFFEGDFESMLTLARSARQTLALPENSLSMDQFVRAELQALARLGHARDFRKLFDQLRLGRRLNQRTWTDPSSQHLAIELLDLCVLEGDLAEAERTIKLTRLFEHICCGSRVRAQTLRLELLDPAGVGRFHDGRSAFWSASDYEHDELLGRLLKIQFDFRRDGRIDEREELELRQRIEGSPYAYLRFLIRRFEMDRQIARGELRGAFQTCRSLLESGRERALLAVVARRLAVSLGLSAPRGLLSDSAIRREHGAEFPARLLGLWPYLAIGASSFNFEWDRKRSRAVVNEIEIPVRAHSPLARLAAILSRGAGKIVTYARIAQAVWGESYRDDYHDKKIQALVFKLKSLAEKHGVHPDFLVNAYGEGYVVGAAPSVTPATNSVADVSDQWVEGQEISTKALQEKLGFNARRAQREIKKLVETGRLEALGGKRNRRYRVVS